MKRLDRLVSMTKALTASSRGVLHKVARIFRPAETGSVNELVKGQEAEETGQPPVPERYIIFSDTDNDLISVKNTLRFAGILNHENEFTGSMAGITIIHTGDLISKSSPDPSVVEYWETLRQDVSRHGGRAELIAGNHEQETWLRMKAGKKHGVAMSEMQKVNSFIETLDLFHVAGHILFMHGYPTVEFLQALLHYKEVTGRNLNRFNEDHYKKSLISIRAMKQYAYVRNGRKINHLQYDIKDAESYYRKNGRTIETLLAKLDIQIVVHGHKPQRSGLQADYEYSKWVPGVRVINNDTNVSRRGIGATVIRRTPSGSFETAFINSTDQTEAFSLTVRRTIGAPGGTITEDVATAS